MKRLASNHFKNGLWGTAGKVGRALLLVGSLALLSRMLAPDAMGGYVLAYSLLQVAVVVGAVGLNLAIVRFIAEAVAAERPGAVRGVVLRAGVIVAGGAGAVGIVLLTGGPSVIGRIFSSPQLASAVLPLSIWVALATFQRLVAEAYRGLGDIRGASLNGGLLSDLLLFGGLVLVLAVGRPVALAGALWMAAGAVALNLVVASLGLRRRIGTLIHADQWSSGPGMREMLSTSAPLLVGNLAFLAFSQGDVWIAAALFAPDQVALYGTAARMTQALSLPLAIVNSVLQPQMVTLHFQDRRSELERMIRSGTTLIAVPVAGLLLLMAALAPWILRTVFGDFYAAGGGILRVLCLAQFVNVVAGSCGLLVNMAGEERRGMVVTLASAGVSLAAAGLLGGALGIHGIAWATVVGYATMNAGFVLVAYRILGVKTYVYTVRSPWWGGGR